MPLYLSNQDQEKAITAREAIDALENGIRQFAKGDAIRRPRIDNFIPTRRTDQFFAFSSMEGGIREPGYYALRIKPSLKESKCLADLMARNLFLRFSHRELKIAPTTPCQPAFESLQRPSEKTDRPQNPYFWETLSDNGG